MSILFDNVSKTYGSSLILDAVSFQVSPGSIVALVGPNGSGKTTLIRILLELAKADSGRAEILGKKYSALMNPSKRVSVLLESAGLDPRATVETQLKLRLGSSSAAKSHFSELLEIVDLNGCQDKQIKSLSLGMRQRLGLACAIGGDHEVYILDEPTNGLDYAGITWLWRLLRSKANDGATVFVTSHHLDELSNVVDRAIGMNSGKFIGEYTVSSDEAKTLQGFYREIGGFNRDLGAEQ